MSILFFALGVTGLLFVALRVVAHVRARELDSNYILIGTAVMLANGTAVVSQFSGGRTLVLSGVDSYVAVLSPAAEQFSKFTLPVMFVVVLGYVVAQYRRGVAINGLAATYLMLLVFSSMGSVLGGGNFITTARLTLLLPVVALLLGRPSAGAIKGAAVALATLLCLSGVLALVSPDQASAVCDARKCGVFGSLFNGVAFNFNGFGLLMALAIPVMYFGLDKFREYFTGFALIAVFATGSRTAQLASAIVVVLLYLNRLLGRQNHALRLFLPSAVCGASALFIVMLPFMKLDPGEFTGRVGLWDLALSQMRGSWLFGLGPDSWAAQVDDGAISYVSAYSTHNQLIEILYVSGIVGLCLYIVLITGLIVRMREALVPLLSILAPALVIGSTERPWTLGIADWLSWSILLLLVIKVDDANTENGKQIDATASSTFKQQRRVSPSGMSMEPAK
uniref:O-antigen ligase family protein n=1 Tax=Microbacterium sp. SORGH_AS_1204 TaxID=3041785 RepID=UPI0027D7C4EB|nr:O-antigen ligase family protein [Microbacterium sp. SORGH_AS_1204]